MAVTTSTGLALQNFPVPAIPTIGVGLHWYYAGSTTIKLYSDHKSGSVFIPAYTSTGMGKILEVAYTSLPMTLNLASSGANGLDTGSVAANKFYCVRMIAKIDGSDPALLATLNAATPTIPSAYSGGYQSDILWGISCSVDYDSSGTTDEISNFIQIAPGVCRYSTGGGGFQGSGLQALSGGAATASTAVDLAYLTPAPVANTAQESVGTALLFATGSNNHPTTRHGYIYYSADGRTDADSGSDDGLEILHRFGRLDNASGDGGRDEAVALEFPLAVRKTTTAFGFSSDSTGTLSNILQYRWTGESDCAMDIYVQGWRIHG